MKSLVYLAWITKELRTATTHGPTSRLAFAQWTSSEQASDTNPRLGFFKGERCWLNAQSQWQVATSVQTSALFSLKLMQLELQDCCSSVLSYWYTCWVYIYTIDMNTGLPDWCTVCCILLQHWSSWTHHQYKRWGEPCLFSHHQCTTLAGHCRCSGFAGTSFPSRVLGLPWHEWGQLGVSGWRWVKHGIRGYLL